MDLYHTSVLLGETIELLVIKAGERYIDATIGGGGHTEAIIDRGGIVLGIDQDQEALDHVQQKFSTKEYTSDEGNPEEMTKKLFLAKGNFKDIDRIAKDNNFTPVAGILFDLGVSSHQLDTAERGFSIQKDGPLDMRMDADLQVKAADLINILTKGELYELFHKLGEERFARTIANNIVRTRRVKPIRTTKELAAVISKAVPYQKSQIDPSTRVFQALRIAVNDELHSLEEVLPKSLKILQSGGRVVVISFHSLEDRIVKHTFKGWESENLGRSVTKKPLTAKDDEMQHNRRSRSAKLRVFEKN
jgi:16S rRNA (cytosine1402-N4)-methyltransferase